jgi:hypothetical protein
MRLLVPHYETFWRLYVFPLRSSTSIWFRNGVDAQLEDIAIASYSTYASLARARQKICTRPEEFRFLEELYAAVQRSAEIGVKLLNQFAAFYTALRHRPSSASSAPLEQLIEGRLRLYRNLLHDAILAMPKDDHRRRLIPKPEYIDQYRRWTTVMYGFTRSHFVVAAEQLRNDFRATCSLLEEGWKRMSEASDDLKDLPEFEAALSKGSDGPALLYTPPTSGAFFLGASSAAPQPTSAAFILPKH